jgi:hypothetical protein
MSDIDSVDYCDYFEMGVGYQFTQFDMVGLFVVIDRIGGERDRYYKNITMTPGMLSWDWKELEGLIKNYTHGTCLPGSGSGEGNATLEMLPYGSEIYKNLTLPFADWNISAQEVNITELDSLTKA